jgi:hypothetical protein
MLRNADQRELRPGLCHAPVPVIRKLLQALHAVFRSHQPHDGSQVFQRTSPRAQEVTRALALA